MNVLNKLEEVVGIFRALFEKNAKALKADTVSERAHNLTRALLRVVHSL